MEKEMTEKKDETETKPKNQESNNSINTSTTVPRRLSSRRSSLMPSEFGGGSCNTFMEYFYVFGANETTVRKEDFYTSSRFTKPGYLKMQLLSKFPPFEKPNSNIDENVIMSHCFPKGFNLYVTEKPNDLPKHECFHFNLDNLNSLGNDDKKIYFTCLLFYEPLSIYYEILIRIKRYTKANEKDKEKQKVKPLTTELKKLIERYYVPKVICLSSFVPFPSEEKYLLTKMLTYINGFTKGVQNNIIVPIEKVIEKLVLGIPRPPKGKFYITYKNNNCIIPNNENDYEIKQRELNQYNYYSYKMHLIFTFKIDDIMEIIKCLLLEIPILFFSQNKEKLTNIFESFMFLIRPFEYQYPHVSILPDVNAGIIEIAKSFAFGINYEYVESNPEKNIKSYFEMMNLNVFNKLIKIVDIDHRILTQYTFSKTKERIILYKDIIGNDDYYIYSKSKEINSDCYQDLTGYELPVHYLGKFKDRLREFLDNNKMKTSDCNMALNRKIGEDYFYYYLASVFQHYNNYLYNTEEETKKICKEIIESKSEDDIPIDHLCKTKEFIKEFKAGDEAFLNKFFQTKIFKNFIIRKYLNNEVDKFTFLHFDETILSKKNRSFFSRKIKTEFLESKILQATHCYGVDTTKNFNQEEYSFISSHKDDLVFYNQRFNGTLFTYYLFPKLLYDNQYFQKIYIPPKFFDKFLYQQMQDYQSCVKALEQPKYFKIYNGDLIVRHLHNMENDFADHEIENDVILLWLRIFCLTFYYCEPKEKIIRFVEMLENIKKVYYLRDNILSLLLITIKKYGEEAMIIKLFETIKGFNYNQFAYMANKIFSPNIREPPPIKQLPIAGKFNINYFKDKEDEQKIFELNIKKIDYILRHRTFWGDGVEGKSEKLKFENPVCPECKKPNSLKKLLRSYEKMDKTMKLRCLNCKKSVEFTCNVKLGFKNNGEEFQIVLYNPYYLYNVLSTNLIKIYGSKIDLNDFRNLYQDFFWNCIMNFKLAGLSCDMLLKYNKLYKVKVEEVKEENINEKKKGKDKNKNDNKQKKFKDLSIVKNIIQFTS